MFRTILLSIHLVAVIVWLGAGLHDLFLTREIRRARGLPQEIPLLKLYGRHAGLAPAAVLVVAAAGLAMSLFLGWGFFTMLWLGIKQAIMASIVVGMALLTPQFAQAAVSIAALADGDSTGLEEIRGVVARIERYSNLMRLGGLLAVVLAVWRPA
jgi:hypothetical protein